MSTSQAAMARLHDRFGKRIFAGLGLAGLLFAAITGLLFGSIGRLVHSSAWVSHSYQVLDAVDRTQDIFTDAQSAERGYVATCNLSLIAPFRTDLPRLYSEISVLRELVADNPAQLRRVAVLNGEVDRAIARMAAVIDTNRRNDTRDAQAMLLDAPNLQATRAVLQTLEAMEDEERALLSGRSDDVRRFTLVAMIAAVIGVAACVALLAFVFGLVRRETRRREASEGSLRDSNIKLSASLVELQRRNGTAHLIAVLGEMLQSCRNTDEAVASAARHITQLVPDAAGTIALFDASRASLAVVQHIGTPGDFADRFEPDACWSLRRGRSHAYGDGASEPRCAHATDGAGAFLCLPLSAQSETLGVLSLHFPQSGGVSDTDRQALQTIAEQLSLALANLALQERLRNQSTRDPLTGLFNRRYMDEALAKELARAARRGHDVAIAMIDIDHFKRFNDTHGHDGGDALLASFAQLLAEHARAEDIVCRYGGEEFAVILPEASLAVAAERMEAVRLAVRQLRVERRGSRLEPVTLSAGVAAYPHHGRTAAAVLHVADTALYQAKTEGRDRVVVAPTPGSLRALLPAGRSGKAGSG